MGVKIIGTNGNVNTNGWPATEWIDSTPDQREVEKDGQRYHLSMNERKTFLDEGVGAALANQNTTTPAREVEDTNTMGSSRF